MAIHRFYETHPNCNRCELYGSKYTSMKIAEFMGEL